MREYKWNQGYVNFFKFLDRMLYASMSGTVDVLGHDILNALSVCISTPRDHSDMIVKDGPFLAVVKAWEVM